MHKHAQAHTNTCTHMRRPRVQTHLLSHCTSYRLTQKPFPQSSLHTPAEWLLYTYTWTHTHKYLLTRHSQEASPTSSSVDRPLPSGAWIQTDRAMSGCLDAVWFTCEATEEENSELIVLRLHPYFTCAGFGLREIIKLQVNELQT